MLIKALAKKEGLHLDNRQAFEYIRSPFSKVDVEGLRTLIGGSSSVSDHDFRESYLSATAYLPDYTGGESALNFMVRNRNVYGDSIYLEETANEILQQFFKDKIPAEMLKNIAKNTLWIAKKYSSALLTGNLWVFCVPKEFIDNSSTRESYISLVHAYGKDCKCHKDTDTSLILGELQNNQLSKHSKCKIGKNPAPQIRLLAPHFNLHSGIDSYIVNALSQKTRNDMEKEVVDLINNSLDQKIA